MSTVPEPQIIAGPSASRLPEHLVLRCRCGDWIDFAKHDGAVYKPRVLCCRQEAFTRFLYDHGLECATPDGQWLTVEPIPEGDEP